MYCFPRILFIAFTFLRLTFPLDRCRAGRLAAQAFAITSSALESGSASCPSPPNAQNAPDSARARASATSAPAPSARAVRQPLGVDRQPDDLRLGDVEQLGGRLDSLHDGDVRGLCPR